MHIYNSHTYNITQYTENTMHTHTAKTTKTHNVHTLITHMSAHAHMHTHNVHIYNIHTHTIYTHTTNFKYFSNLLYALQFSKMS